MKLREIEREAILRTLVAKGGNKTHTARELGIGLRTLQRKLGRYVVEGHVIPTRQGGENEPHLRRPVV
jgi:DNA-binding NtrC family response regulator